MAQRELCKIINEPASEKNPTPSLSCDTDYTGQMVRAAMVAAGVTDPDNPPTGIANAQYLIDRILEFRNNGEGTSDGYSSYWWDTIVNDILNIGAGSSSGTGGDTGASGVPNVQKGGGAKGALVNAQLGLLEDDLVYRLSLLAVNVLQPLKDKYPNIVITSGFRQNNTGIGQHELGEACDIQIQNQTPTLLYEVADYIAKFLNFDQLILNWTAVGTGEPWIHVSFSAKTLRGSVMTKDLADTFHEGLFLVTPLTGEALAAAQRDQAAQDDAIFAELQNQQSRQTKLGLTPPEVLQANNVPNTSDGSGITAGGSGTGGTGSTGSGGGGASEGPGFGLDNVIIMSSPDVRGWNETTQITEWGMTPGNMHLVFDGQQKWGSVDIGGGTLQQATLWVVLNINGTWYATAAERLRPNQQNKPEDNLFSRWIGTAWLYDTNRWGIMTGYVPAIGEKVGVMVTQGSERSDANWTTTERSPIFWFNWPQDGTAFP